MYRHIYNMYIYMYTYIYIYIYILPGPIRAQGGPQGPGP